MTTFRVCSVAMVGLLAVATMLAGCGVSVPANLNNVIVDPIQPPPPVLLTIGDVAMPGATLGAAYTHTITAAGGAGGYVWSIATGALPAGLMLSTTATGAALIDGMPSAAATASFQLCVTDSAGNASVKDTTLTVTDPQIVPAALVYSGALQFDIFENSAFTITLGVTGGVAPYTWALASNPGWVDGLNSASGELTGTAPAIGGSNTSDVTFTVSDSSLTTGPNPVPQVIVQTVQLHVIQFSVSSISITSPATFDVPEGVAFSIQLTATGGLAPYSWTLHSAPQWVTGLGAASGQLTGTAPALGATNSYTVTFGVDSSTSPSPGILPLRNVQLNVVAAPLVVTTTTLPIAYEGAPYGVNPVVRLEATGGVEPYVEWDVGGPGLLQAGLLLDPATGTISGTPDAGSSDIRSLFIVVKDSAGTRSAFGHMVTLEVRPIGPMSIDTTPLADGFVGVSYSAAIAAPGGIAPCVWSYISGLPAGTGLSFTADGTLAGTPTLADAAFNSIEVEVLDSLGRTQRASVGFAIFNGAPTLTISADLPAAGIGSTCSFINFGPGTPYYSGSQVYEGWITASGGTAPYQFAISSRGTLPDGFVLDPVGVLRGWNASGSWPSTMGSGGTYTFKVRAADAQGAYCLDDVSIEVVPCAGAAITPVLTVLPTAYEGVPYSFKPTAAMPFAAVTTSNPYGQVELHWRLTSGALPAGLKIFQASASANGSVWAPEVFGMPAYGSSRSYTLEFEIQDVYAPLPKVTWACTLNVSTAPFHIVNRSNLAGGLAGQPYGDKIVAAGGQSANVRWAVRPGSGTLPAGVTLDTQTGEINGTIAASAVPGTYTCIVDATENIAGGTTASFKANIAVGAAPVPGSLVKIAGGAGCGRYVDGYYDGVAAVNALVDDVWGLAFDASGNLLVAETRCGSRVRIIDRKTRLISTVAGRRVGGSPGNGVPAIDASLDIPLSVAVDRMGTIYIGDYGGFIRKIDSAGIVHDFKQFAHASGVPWLAAMTINPAGTHMYVANMLRHDIVEIDLGSGAWDVIAGQTGDAGDAGDNFYAGEANLNKPAGLGFDAQGNLYITELAWSSTALSEPRVRKIAVDPARGNKVSYYSIITTLGGSVGTSPVSDLAVDASGHLYYVAAAGASIARLDLATPNLPPVYLAGSGGIPSVNGKRGLAKDPLNGDIYISTHDGYVYKIVQ